MARTRRTTKSATTPPPSNTPDTAYTVEGTPSPQHPAPTLVASEHSSAPNACRALAIAEKISAPNVPPHSPVQEKNAEGEGESEPSMQEDEKATKKESETETVETKITGGKASGQKRTILKKKRLSSASISTEMNIKQQLEHYQSRQMPKGMSFDFKWFKSLKEDVFPSLIRAQGWEYMMGNAYRNPILENELGQFYCYMTVNDNVVESVVNGKGVTFDVVKLGEILKVPSVGYVVHDKGGSPTLDYISTADVIKKFSNGAVTVVDAFHQSNLSYFHKLVYNIVRRSLVPRAEKRNEVEVLDAVLMELLCSKKQINFPQLMITHMWHMKKGHNYSLPYGSLITAVLQHFGVPMQYNEGKNPREDDVMGKKAMHNLQVAYISGQYVLKPDEHKRKVEDAEQKGVPAKKQRGEKGGEPEKQAGAPQGFVTMIIEQFLSVGDKLAQLGNQVENMEKKLEALGLEIKSVETTVGTELASVRNAVKELQDTSKQADESLMTTFVESLKSVTTKLAEFETEIPDPEDPAISPAAAEEAI